MDNGGKISGSYSETLRKTRFLVFDEDLNGKRFVGFASNEGLEILSNGNVCFVDGTFDCVPKGFTQLFSISIGLPIRWKPGIDFFNLLRRYTTDLQQLKCPI